MQGGKVCIRTYQGALTINMLDIEIILLRKSGSMYISRVSDD